MLSSRPPVLCCSEATDRTGSRSVSGVSFVSALGGAPCVDPSLLLLERSRRSEASQALWNGSAL